VAVATIVDYLGGLVLPDTPATGAARQPATVFPRSQLPRVDLFPHRLDDLGHPLRSLAKRERSACQARSLEPFLGQSRYTVGQLPSWWRRVLSHCDDCRGGERPGGWRRGISPRPRSPESRGK
jgi:hypothetical protein